MCILIQEETAGQINDDLQAVKDIAGHAEKSDGEFSKDAYRILTIANRIQKKFLEQGIIIREGATV